MRTLILDIETSPLEGYFWRRWKENIGMNQIKEDWAILSWAAKWLGEKPVISSSVEVEDGPPFDDRDSMALLREFLNKADVVVAHNGNKFDIPKINTRFLYHGILPPSPFKKVDTFLVAKKQFAFTSNRLDDLAKFLDVGEKINVGGFDLWRRCMEGDEEALAEMIRYNIRDVEILESVYLKLRPWIANHPNAGNYTPGESSKCPKCGSVHLQRRGFAYTQVGKYQQFQCQSCGGWSRSRNTIHEKEHRQGILNNAN